MVIVWTVTLSIIKYHRSCCCVCRNNGDSGCRHALDCWQQKTIGSWKSGFLGGIIETIYVFYKSYVFLFVLRI